jgi:aminoglycoside 3-N-acetyltransferase
LIGRRNVRRPILLLTVSSRSHTVAEVTRQLQELGVRLGAVLEVHTSFRRVRPVENGPRGLIEALQRALGPEGTLVMPTMTDGEGLFDPATTPTHDMGITAELFWRQPGVLRSSHPGASFAAAGPLAGVVCAPHPLSPPHGPDSPPGRVVARGGQVLLLGVEHSENTILHVAECAAGVPYSVEHPCVVEVEGDLTRMMLAETDHCCRGFCRVDAWLAENNLQREGMVGRAKAKLVDARALVDVAVERLRRDPLVFLCAPEANCAECDAARASVKAA